MHPQHDEAAWQQHGALLAAVDRLRIEVEASVRPSCEAWQPHLVFDRQRSALRRMRRTGPGRGRPPTP